MSSSKNHINISKFLSLVLRHCPEKINLILNENGWANIEELISKSNASEGAEFISKETLHEVVKQNIKKRFTISSDGKSIRANQGHSVKVDLQLTPVIPPEILYHGTTTKFLDSILKEGLKSRQRQHVHLSIDIVIATTVGKRHGKHVILTIQSLLMHNHGYKFFLSENGVWLTEIVPINFINL